MEICVKNVLHGGGRQIYGDELSWRDKTKADMTQKQDFFLLPFSYN